MPALRRTHRARQGHWTICLPGRFQASHGDGTLPIRSTVTRLKRLNRRTRSTGTKSASPSESKNALSVIQSAVTLWPKLTTPQDRPFIHRAPAPNARHPRLNRKHPTKNSAAITVAKPASNQSALNGWINIESINADLLDCSQVRIVLPYLEDQPAANYVSVAGIRLIWRSDADRGS